jgi:elongation factor Ts
MDITAKMVSDLRERTGAALMDCKRALTACNGDLDAAVDYLRKTGLKSAEKRVGRSTSEGRVQGQFAADAKSAAMAMLTCETDFAARSEDFKILLTKLVKLAFDKRIGSPEALLEQRLEGGTAQDAIKALSAKCGENVQLPQVSFLENKNGFVGGYIHHNDKAAALASVTTKASPEKAAEFLKNLGMHITFAKPQALSREQISADAVEREKVVYLESDEVKAKPEDKRAMIVKGKLEKFFGTVVLPEQPWFKDDKTTVKKVLADALGPDAKIEAFTLFVVGA